MRLKDVALVRVGLQEADFWLVRRGTLQAVGQPVREYSPYHIGIRVEQTGLILPDYLFYVFMELHQGGQWQAQAIGTLELVHIRTEDVNNINLLIS